MEFSNTFIQTLKKDYYQLTNDIILKDIKNNFDVELDEELKIIYDNLDDAQNAFNKKIKNISTFKADDTMKNILDIYNKFKNNLINYNSLKINENNDKKIKENIVLLMNEIGNKLNEVSNYFEMKMNETKIKMNQEIERNLEFKTNFMNKLDSENKIEKTENAYENLILIKTQVEKYSHNLLTDLLNKISDVTEEDRKKKKKKKKKKKLKIIIIILED